MRKQGGAGLSHRVHNLYTCCAYAFFAQKPANGGGFVHGCEVRLPLQCRAVPVDFGL